MKSVDLGVIVLVATVFWGPTPTCFGQRGLQSICQAFSGFDQDGDGDVEIDDLQVLQTGGENGARVLLLVESRLLKPLEGAPALLPPLRRWVEDLARESRRAALIAVSLEANPRHQDGRYVLALREFLRAVAKDGDLAGVVLVGRFPDALLVRVCNWRKRERLVLRKGRPNERRYGEVSFLRRVPEIVARRADIVLADLNGRWEDVYRQPRTWLPTLWAAYPGGVPVHGGRPDDFEEGVLPFEDFFYVLDGRVERLEEPSQDGGERRPSWLIFDDDGDLEVGAEDRRRSNPMAVPDILVSRLDARGVALRPKSRLRGEAGHGFLDAQGHPQSVRFKKGTKLPHWRNEIWEHDPILERRLLAAAMDRNHAYRTGRSQVAWRPASLACGLPSGYDATRRAAEAWSEEDREHLDVRGSPTLTAVAKWLGYPAILRTIRAHSDAWGSVFARGDIEGLKGLLGKPPWAWTPRGAFLVPSLDAACGGGKLDWFFWRTAWERGGVVRGPSFYVHTGCDGISPPGAETLPFDHADYGVRQGGEAMLFFGEGLALVGRAKVFYDEPRGFAETLGAGESFGEAWARYFEIEGAAKSKGEVGGEIGRKRAYFWSVLGDWTLSLAMARHR
ncbi:MAG TPA: hypothetical protein ENK43_04315 [Planctomycetes bacterium]|nr:hypothetical protein [Planctomycetota bacterium]